MKRINLNNETSPTWFSEETDWNTSAGPIAVWDGCLITEEEYPDFIGFVKKECGADVEPVGSFNTAEGLAIFVFIVKSNVSQFSIWRFRLPGMRWWFDMFWEVNGGRVVKETEILPILEKLNLKYSEACPADIFEEEEEYEN